MKKIVFYVSVLTFFLLINYSCLFAQAIGSLSEKNGTRYIRVANAGELADTVNVWGDVTSEGRYIIPKGTTLPELVSFSLGYKNGRGIVSRLNGGKTVVQVKVSRYNATRKKVKVSIFKYRFDKPEPAKMFDYNLHNNDIVSLQVRRKATFKDFVQVVAPVISVIATSVLLFKKL